MPVTYKGVGDEGLITLTATVLFGNALFRTDIKLAPVKRMWLIPHRGNRSISRPARRGW